MLFQISGSPAESPVQVDAPTATDAFIAHWGMAPGAVTDATELGYLDPLAVASVDVQVNRVELRFERLTEASDRLVLEVEPADVDDDDEAGGDVPSGWSPGQPIRSDAELAQAKQAVAEYQRSRS